jgi:hypothetical protein
MNQKHETDNENARIEIVPASGQTTFSDFTTHAHTPHTNKLTKKGPIK